MRIYVAFKKVVYLLVKNVEWQLKVWLEFKSDEEDILKYLYFI